RASPGSPAIAIPDGCLEGSTEPTEQPMTVPAQTETSSGGARRMRRHRKRSRLGLRCFTILMRNSRLPKSPMLPYCCSTTTRREHRHMPTNLWQPGVSGNPTGRLRGSRNRLSEEVICALLRDFRKHGAKAMAKGRREQRGVDLRCLTLLGPREGKVEHSNAIKEMTDEQLERGIELIKEMIAKRDAEANAKVIEGVALVRRSDRADSGLAARVV